VKTAPNSTGSVRQSKGVGGSRNRKTSVKIIRVPLCLWQGGFATLLQCRIYPKSALERFAFSGCSLTAQHHRTTFLCMAQYLHQYEFINGDHFTARSQHEYTPQLQSLFRRYQFIHQSSGRRKAHPPLLPAKKSARRSVKAEQNAPILNGRRTPKGGQAVRFKGSAWTCWPLVGRCGRSLKENARSSLTASERSERCRRQKFSKLGARF
jgi:hypothetical protein